MIGKIAIMILLGIIVILLSVAYYLLSIVEKVKLGYGNEIKYRK